MQKLAGWLGKVCFGFSTICLMGFIFLLSGAWGTAVDWRDHRVNIEIAHDIKVKDASQSLTAEDFRQINCLAVNMYFEAGNQGRAGMAAIGDVVFNRLNSGVFPDRICQVIYQGTRDTEGHPILNRCQFSWFCDGKQHSIRDKAVYRDCYEVAYNQYLYRQKMPDITSGATYYHADYVDPHRGVWKKAKPILKIGAHIFYNSGGQDESSKKKVDKRVSLR